MVHSQRQAFGDPAKPREKKESQYQSTFKYFVVNRFDGSKQLSVLAVIKSINTLVTRSMTYKSQLERFCRRDVGKPKLEIDYQHLGLNLLPPLSPSSEFWQSRDFRKEFCIKLNGMTSEAGYPANREIFRIINSTTPLEIEPLKFCVNLNSKSSSKSSNPYASLTKVDGTHLTTSLAVQLSQRGPSRGGSGWSAAPLHSASLVLRQTRLRKRDLDELEAKKVEYQEGGTSENDGFIFDNTLPPGCGIPVSFVIHFSQWKGNQLCGKYRIKQHNDGIIDRRVNGAGHFTDAAYNKWQMKALLHKRVTVKGAQTAVHQLLTQAARNTRHKVDGHLKIVNNRTLQFRIPSLNSIIPDTILIGSRSSIYPEFRKHVKWIVQSVLKEQGRAGEVIYKSSDYYNIDVLAAEYKADLKE
ncbi:hypothetical protein JCM16303_004388 [Sporobolomyces ruberrimus]